jgi:hypothetical protein
MGGVSNKNLGEAFLMVWKFPKEYVTEDEKGNLTLVKNSSVKQISDLALISFIKIVANINLS